MSSGEKAKPPATFEERNPFDISRNSGPQVAAEIAKRMAAWKQARAYAGPAATTAPSTTPSGKVPSGDAKLPPPIAAPVQPARMPKAARESQPAQTAPATERAGSAASRVPYFAVSATRRAMPPAPSLKQARPLASERDEVAVQPEEPVITPAAAVPEQAPQDQHERTLQVADAAPASEPAVIEASPPVIIETDAADAPAEPSGAHPFEAPLAARAPEPAPGEPSVEEPSADSDERTRRRAEARAIKARWMAAHDLDALLERPAADTPPAIEPAEPATPDTGIVTAGDPDADAGREMSASEARATAEDVGSPLTEEQPRDADDRLSAHEPDAAFDAPAHVTVPDEVPAAEPEATAAPASPIAALEEAAGRKEPTFEAPIAPVSETARDAEHEARTRDIAALDEMAGRKEPTFDTPVTHAAPDTRDAASEFVDEAPDEAIAPLRVERVAAEASDPIPAAREAADDPRARAIAALDAMAGRREPTFDGPISVTSDGDAAHAPNDAEDEATSAPIAVAEVAPALTVEATNELPAPSIDALEDITGRKEPTFDEPVRPAVVAPAIAHKAAPSIKLRPIETRIEARRVDTLRADPPLTARRPIFPHIEQEEWDVPPAVAARSVAARRGAGWAIGLGSLLLIVGITAPAAIWQQGRQVQDQAALVPTPDSQQTSQQTTTADGAGTTPAPTPQATLPEAPQPETPQPEARPPAPAVTAQQADAPAVKPAPEAGKDPASAPPATTLGAIGGSEEVNEAPIVAPTPMVNLASKQDAAGSGAPMVVRPFVPEQGEGPFLRAPTTGVASVPVGTPQPGAQPVGTGVKPNLMGQLKPKAATVASTVKPLATKPRTTQPGAKPFFQQSPDQMFDTLIETLSEGRPVNPNTKPASPSNRR